MYLVQVDMNVPIYMAIQFSLLHAYRHEKHGEVSGASFCTVPLLLQCNGSDSHQLESMDAGWGWEASDDNLFIWGF